MFVVNEDLSVYVTRGDIVTFPVQDIRNGKPRKFQVGEVVRFKVFEKKNCEKVVLQKDFPVEEEAEQVVIVLTPRDTKIGEVISKPKDYWYEVELNPFDNNDTFIGYDEGGARLFRLYPEGGDAPPYEPEPDSFPIVDEKLDMISPRPVANQVIARAFGSLKADFEKIKSDIESRTLGAEIAVVQIDNSVAVQRARVDNLLSAGSVDGSEVTDIRVGADGTEYASAGTAVRTQVGNLKSHVDLISGGKLVAFSPTEDQIYDGGILNVKGNMLASEVWIYTDFIEIPFVPLYKVNLTCTIDGYAAVVFYDKNKQVLLGIDGYTVGNYGYARKSTKETYTFTLPEGTAYIRLCGCKQYNEYNSAEDFILEGVVHEWCDSVNLMKEQVAESVASLHDVEHRIDSVSATYKDKKVIVFGDSISADAYGSYTKWVTMLIEEGFFPTDTVNSSQHATGFVARYNNIANDYISRIEAVEDSGEYDLVVVFGGINDFIRSIPMGESSGDILSDFIPAVDHFFSYLVNNFVNARIVVFTPLHTFATWANTVGNKQEVYADYIKSVAKKYHLPILDLTNESGFYPDVPAFSRRWTLMPAGYDVTDGVHPTEEYQRKFLMPMIKGFLRNLI